jgi:hypothetical protein
MFTAAHKAAHPIEIGQATRSGNSSELAEAMDEDEKQQIMEQLKMLGYIE